MSGDGVKGRGINGRGPRSGRAPVYAAKALEADATFMLRGMGLGEILPPTPATRRARGLGRSPMDRTCGVIASGLMSELHAHVWR